MQAIILAAGMGKRLKELTKNNTKCMVKVNGVTLIDRMLHQLDSCALNRVVMVVGYEGEKLIEYVNTLDIKTPIMFVNNPIFDKTNNIYSLYLAKKQLLEDDTLLLESDIIFEDSLLQLLLDDPRDTLALVDKYESWMDGTCIKIGENDCISAFVPGKEFVTEDIPTYYKTVNIYKFSKHFSETRYVPFLDAYSKALGDNEYYEQVLRVITMLDNPGIQAKRLNGQLWYEIDDVQDLDIAESIFAEGEDQLQKLQGRYGGYWRYPHLLDFCYLVNPYYPPQRMTDEIKANFETLLTQYPSGARVNNLLAAKNFNIRAEHILLGNGAAELINCLMSRLTGKVGVVRPTFEEYPNRCKNDTVVFTPTNKDFSYSADDLIHFFADKSISSLILINPDNPTGHYLPKQEILDVVTWCKENNIEIVVDESFADFADEESNSLLDEKVLQAYPNLIVMKSISKSYGVPGLRLGILASGNEKLISELNKDVSIWNINSFGEFYMQIAEKYKNDYESALTSLRQERQRFIKELCKISTLRVLPSQANYVMVELLSGMSAKELTTKLLTQHGILIKDLSAKITDGQYIRIAVRSKEDNEKLVVALKEIL